MLGIGKPENLIRELLEMFSLLTQILLDIQTDYETFAERNFLRTKVFILNLTLKYF